jgi:2,4-dienoyl-CoA reductase-like NADH-dependent reductase (Old Yellow Enzyme family)
MDLRNRIVMAPMTRAMSPGGVPGENVARYYKRRAEGGVGLIITEGTFIPHPSAGHDDNAPRIYGDDALSGWRRVVEQVHGAGARIFAQLWHVGLVRKPQVDGVGSLYQNRPTSDDRFSPSGIIGGNGLPLDGGKSADRQPRLAASRPKRHSPRPLQPRHAPDPRLTPFANFDQNGMNTDTREVRR